METVLGVHTREELDLALSLAPEIIGINNRNLRSPGLTTDISVTRRLLERVPDDVTVVTESGFGLDAKSRQELRKLQHVGPGIDAALVGEALMRFDNPEQAVRALRANGTSWRG